MKPRQTTALAPIDEMRSSLTKMESEFKKALPSSINVEKFTRVIMTAIQQTPDLLQCNRNSFYGAAMKAAADGLLPDGREAAFVIFNTKAGKLVVYMPMTFGILKKFKNSGEYLSVSCHVVHVNDDFDYWIDDSGEHLRHKPILVSDRGEPTLAYFIARMKSGGIQIEVMNEEEIEKVRSVSRAKDKGPWVDWKEEMWRKTVLKRGSKKIPLSPDLQNVIERDDELYSIKEVQEIKEPKTKSSRLQKLVEDAEPEEKPVENLAGQISEGQEEFKDFEDFE